MAFHPYATRGETIFQPPTSPASTTASLTQPASGDYFSSRARKRARPDSSHSQTHDDSSRQEAQSWPAQYPPTPSDGMGMSSGPGVNERYCLAGGFDTPGLLATSENEHYADQNFRTCVRDREAARRGDGTITQMSGPLARERNGVARLPSSPNAAASPANQGWTRFAFGLVGRVFSFGTSVIKGFYAGGGKGFDLHQQRSLSESWLPERSQGVSTPVPGAWQSDEFLGDFEQDNPDSPRSTTRIRPPNKRRQTDRDSWVLVGTPEVNVDGSPRRKPSSGIRPSLSTRPGASRANSRRSLAPVSRRTSSYVSHAGSPAQLVMSPATTTQEDITVGRRASIAPFRASTSRPSSSGAVHTPTQHVASSVTAEAERFRKQQLRQEKSMSSMSRHVEDLVRQAREALGTKVSVEGEAFGSADLDEGFVDEDW